MNWLSIHRQASESLAFLIPGQRAKPFCITLILPCIESKRNTGKIPYQFYLSKTLSKRTTQSLILTDFPVVRCLSTDDNFTPRLQIGTWMYCGLMDALVLCIVRFDRTMAYRNANTTICSNY